ncbi:MAG TPA: hypothetical protein EYP69_00740 [Bacteroidales bacterium]|nr:hypothetical protein [Bacteroidales bacterium]
MPSIILSTAYHPSILYFILLNSAPHTYIDIYEHYYKQSYRNRCHILSPNGKIALSVPIKKSNKHKTPLCEIEIDYETNWIHNHIKAIETTYYPTPFFEIIYPDILRILNLQPRLLTDINKIFLEYYIDMLGLNILPLYSHAYIENKNNKMQDFRDILHPKKNYSQDYPFLKTPYYQVFLHKFGFIPELSILDLLFHMGSEAGLYIRNLSKHYKQLA